MRMAISPGAVRRGARRGFAQVAQASEQHNTGQQQHASPEKPRAGPPMKSPTRPGRAILSANPSSSWDTAGRGGQQSGPISLHLGHRDPVLDPHDREGFL